jgi:hypothetical protein
MMHRMSLSLFLDPCDRIGYLRVCPERIAVQTR